MEQPRIYPGEWDTQISLGFWDTDRLLISARQPDLLIVNKNRRGLAVPADHRIKLKESEKKDKYLDLATELKNLWNMKIMVILIIIGTLGTFTKRQVQVLEDLFISRGNSNYSIIKIYQNTEKCPGDLRRLAVTQIPLKRHRLALGWKLSKELATVVEGDQKATFSIATTPKCRGRPYSFPRVASLYPWYVPYIAEC